MGISAVVVNVRVVPQGAGTDRMPGFAQYLGLRDGAMAEPTPDDARLAHEMELPEMAGYYALRPGALTEDGSALFDRNGAVSVADARERFQGITSSAITMTVSVRNEDAERFGLANRQDWERLVRGCADRYIQSTGTISPQDIEYVAAAHVNGVSHHAHIVAYDSSGTWQGSMIPKRRLTAANNELKSTALRPVLERLAHERSQARDELTAALRSGRALGAADAATLRSLLPEEGRTSFEHLATHHPTAAEGVRAAVASRISGSTELSECRSRYLGASRSIGELRGLKGEELDAYVSKAEGDFEKRCCNAAIAAAKGSTSFPLHTEGEGPVPSSAPVQEAPHAGAEPWAPSHGSRFCPYIPPRHVAGVGGTMGGGGASEEERRKKKRRHGHRASSGE